ncbi:MAG: hypothetical protein DIZ80_10330 [endosymbiont of Galathealinum brachiosum]|uniref:DUF1631 domain-containing protein n=1 Tax=endosymbiont of Galathealinum brachiosum TaxID=2200906 RepID=A0A370DED7_9GAMM|nr:MAG: hypothetical protein DIZ80_10330 [endosymbiont of Galathealinum brachiosum]
MNTENNKPESIESVNTDKNMHISDPEYISKVINQFILNDDKTHLKVAAHASAARSQHYNREHILHALTNIQLTFKPRYIPGQTVNVNTEEFKLALMESMAKLDKVAIPKTMNQIDSRTIDFVEMIFGVFIRDKNISDIIKSLLLLIQIPILKISLTDSNFFNNDTHPARHVLNSIAHLGIGIEDTESTLYQTIHYIIDQLLHSFDNNIVAFITAKASLDRLSDIQKNKFIKTENHTQHLIAIEYTQQLVLKELKHYTSNIKIPKELQPLILSHWSTLMFHRFISYGKDSIEWREAVGILRLLVKSFNPINKKDEWVALRSIYKGIVNCIRSSLNNTRQNKEKIFIATSNLNNYYFSKLCNSEFFSSKNNDSDDEDTEFILFNTLYDNYTSDIEPSPFDLQAENSKSSITNMPEVIKINEWFEVFTDYSHPVRRLKLSSIMDVQATLIFVDYMGNKVIEKDLESFITELKNDQSRLINDHSIFEYALSMVIISIAAIN